MSTSDQARLFASKEIDLIARSPAGRPGGASANRERESGHVDSIRSMDRPDDCTALKEGLSDTKCAFECGIAATCTIIMQRPIDTVCDAT